ncbi:MAG: TRAP transporter small permease [Deltaproteobacteria bacterium]|nr:TRAP transporter small permease [Deltaproteobacteria bacterium]
MKFIRRLSQILEHLESALASLALITMIILGSLQVALRNIWDTGITWGDPIVRALVIWVGFLFVSMATHQRGHIRFDVLSKFLPERLKNLCLGIVHLASSTVCLYLLEAAWNFLKDEKEFGGMLVEGLPNHWALSIIPISFAIMGARFLMLSLEDIKHFISPDSKEEESNNTQIEKGQGA